MIYDLVPVAEVLGPLFGFCIFLGVYTWYKAEKKKKGTKKLSKKQRRELNGLWVRTPKTWLGNRSLHLSWLFLYAIQGTKTTRDCHSKESKVFRATRARQDRVRYILENIPESRNMKNKDFVFLYWNLVSKLNIVSNEVIKTLDDPESIRRCRQLLAQHNKEKYGATNQEHLTEKALKESGTYQFVLERYQ